MSTDDDYANFLDKANQDTGVSKDKSDKDNKFASTKAVDSDTNVPSHLQKLDAYYTSDTDEPFEPVSLKHNGKDLSKSNFGKLIGHDGEVVPSDIKHFNPKGKYDDVVDAVSKCSDGNHVVKVFRVEHGGPRVEYYLVTIDKDGNVVGVKVKAVES
ncbi:hypothetical protein K461DRAFT_267226 [Myriangium duriaei CBS 260.36]|uniref:Uncharacterized protein n=1 Tax=Myriangium duriaei CBS 260.36 TaxID=1168546 RepID=A0A9P4J837_9PEZI|nr:hypothetical protein K461DRAFT_267226 [Myriangium duriaei CBS 260.36]